MHEEHDGRTNRKGKDVIGRQSLEMEPQNDMQAMEGRKMDKPDPQQEACSREGEQQNEGQIELDNPDDWGCPIVEEHATKDFITSVTNAKWHFT